MAKEIINPMKENNWSMNFNGTATDDPTLIANTFNIFFVKKIEDLKANIDPSLITDPLKYLNDSMKSNTSTFNLQTVSMKCLKKTISQLKSKNSTGSDGLSQKQLKAGVSILASPLQNVINASIRRASF